MDTFILDFETTGLSPLQDAVLEVALRGPRPLHAYVKDAPASSPEAFAVHGLHPEWLKFNGRSGCEVLRDLLVALGEGPVRVVAHNARFEREFLTAWATREGLLLPEVDWVCTRDLAKKVLGPSWKGFSLGHLVQEHGWDHGPLHRASEDTLVTERLLHALEAWASLKETIQTPNPVLYLAGPVRGDGTPQAIEHNQARMKGIARLVQAVLPDAALIVPHTNFLFLDESGPEGLALRSRILEACEALVRRSDALLVSAAHPTEGVRREMAVAQQMGIPILTIPAFDPAGLVALSHAG